MKKLQYLFGIPAGILYLLSIFTIATKANFITEILKLKALFASWVYFVGGGFCFAIGWLFITFVMVREDGE